MSPVFPIVQTKPVAKGTPEYETLRDSIVREQFTKKVPASLLLPQSLIDNPPKDVTSVPRSSGLLSIEELDITENYDATALAAAIRERKLTSVAVTTAFAKRAIIAHQLTCCLTEWFMDDALAQAQSLDEHLERTGKPLGPLHGVPISIKEHMQMAGHWSADGYLASRTVDKEDAHTVGILRKLGAVFYCKTNQPQGIMHLETVSPYGRTLNPHNIHLSAGGSSGGEGALIALRGSVLGMGSDIGGSIRGPSGFCGIYGFKPTSYYMPGQGHTHGGFPAELTILATGGPMAGSLRDLDLLMSSVLGQQPFLREPSLVPLPWTGPRKALPQRPLKVGFLMNDGAIQPQPPVTRALEWAKAKLSGAETGLFDVKPFTPYRAAEAITNIRRAYFPDGGAALKAGIAKTGEPLEHLTQWILKPSEGESYTWQDMFNLRMERDEFRAKYAEHWTQQDVDVLIAPVFVGPASVHDTALYWNYTAFFNYVDYPGVVVPTPLKALKKGEEQYASSSQILSEEDAHVRKLWEEGDFEGAPIALQIVARKYHDNELFAALEAMKEVLELK